MKKMVILILFLSLPMSLIGQSFTFNSDTLNFYGQPGVSFDQYADIHNVSGQDLYISIIRTQNDLPDTMWTSSICTGQACFPPEVDTLNYSFYFGAVPPGSTVDFHLQVSTNPNIPGTAVITIKVENQNNLSDTASLTFTFSTEATRIKQKPSSLSGNFQLFANYPNPFNPETTIPFEIGGFQSVPTKLSIYNILGQLIAVPLNRALSPGLYEVTWDGRDKSGRSVSSGLYFYELSAGNFRMMDKMIFLK